MKILVDAFGGDFCPFEAVKGAVEYVEQGGNAEITLVGMEDEINKVFEENNFSKKNISIINATQVITCEEAPTDAFKNKQDSSMMVGIKNLKSGEYDALVSSGSTGALLTGAVLKIGRLKGVSRPALGTLLPTVKGGKVMFLDCGANVDCKPINLVHFAIMANVYMKNVEGIDNPRIALLSNGAEDQKGDELTKTVNEMLRKIPEINFVGNAEGCDILSGDFDAIITDGFSGNIAIKSLEGTAGAILSVLKKNIMESLKAKIGFQFFLKKAFKKTLKQLDYNSMGGAVFLGVNGVIAKSHGSSKSKTFVGTLFQAEKAVQNNINADIVEGVNLDSVKSLKVE